MSSVHLSTAGADLRAWLRHSVDLEAHLVIDRSELMAARTKDFSARSFAFLVEPDRAGRTSPHIGCNAVASVVIADRAVRIGGKLARVNRNNAHIEVGFIVPDMLHPAAYELLMRVAYAKKALEPGAAPVVEKACTRFPDLAQLCVDRFDERLLVHIEWASGHDKPFDPYFRALVQLRANRNEIDRAAQSTTFSDNVSTDVLIRKLRDPFWMMDMGAEVENLLTRVVQEVALAEAKGV